MSEADADRGLRADAEAAQPAGEPGGPRVEFGVRQHPVAVDVGGRVRGERGLPGEPRKRCPGAEVAYGATGDVPGQVVVFGRARQGEQVDAAVRVGDGLGQHALQVPDETLYGRAPVEVGGELHEAGQCPRLGRVDVEGQVEGRGAGLRRQRLHHHITTQQP
ncbi:hypothetical protein AAFH96_34970, partial [Polymorphospora sp. 2-325]